MSEIRAQVENLVIGGGLAGAMAALGLASAGRSVVLLERERGPHHKVCGEFLSAEAVGYLRGSGIDPVQLGAAPIRHLRLSTGTRIAETSLPFAALSLSRCVLDRELLHRAAQAGVEVRRGVNVTDLRRADRGWEVAANGASPISAQRVFLATGKHDLRGWGRGPGRHGDLVGFKMHFRLAPGVTDELREWMELFLFPGGYGGLSLVEEEIANLCLVVRRTRLRALGSWEPLLKELAIQDRLLRYRLAGATPLWERPLAVSAIPYGYLVPSGGREIHAAEHAPEFWRLGDQAAVIPSFTGDGMSIALHSGALAAQFCMDGASASDFHRALAGQLRPGMRLATLLSRAIVSSAGRKSAPLALTLGPGLMRWIAAATRIPRRSLLCTPIQATGDF